MVKMKKNVTILLVLCFLMLVLTGCGNRIPEMTEEQNALITEYAAGLLLKHHADYDGRLVDTSVPPPEEPILEMPEVIVSDNTIAEKDSAEETESLVEKPETVALSISQVLGVIGFDINCRGYEVCDCYPSEEASLEELFFTMKAGTENKLLVLKMEVKNTSGQEMELDTLSMTDLDCKILMNGNDTQRAYVSMLENDFMAIKRKFAIDETYEAIIITEMPAEKAQAVETVQLQMKRGDHETTISVTE